MDANDERRLALAAKVWRDAKASDAEVERHVVRVARRLRTARRHHPLRRFLAFLIAVLSFGGALAFAASGSGGVPWFKSLGEAQKPAPGGVAAAALPAIDSNRSDVAGPATSPAAADRAGEERAAPAREAAEPDAGSAEGPSERRATAPQDGATATPHAVSGSAAPAARATRGSAETRLWHTVSSALAKDDLSTAATALQRLAARGSGETRVKARLGLVQLAVSRGDCTQAERLAKGLAADLDSEDRVVKRALQAARACFGR